MIRHICTELPNFISMVFAQIDLYHESHRSHLGVSELLLGQLLIKEPISLLCREIRNGLLFADLRGKFTVKES